MIVLYCNARPPVSTLNKTYSEELNWKVLPQPILVLPIITCSDDGIWSVLAAISYQDSFRGNLKKLKKRSIDNTLNKI